MTWQPIWMGLTLIAGCTADKGPSHDSSNAALRFSEVATAIRSTCALTLDGRPLCWGDTEAMGEPPAADALVGLSCGGYHCCALDGSNTVCWGREQHGETTAPSGVRLTNVAVSLNRSAGVTTGGAPLFWGYERTGSSNHEDPPSEDVASLCLSSTGGCSLSTLGQPSCWGDSLGGVMAFEPTTSLLQLDCNSNRAAGVRASGQAFMWGPGDGEPFVLALEALALRWIAIPKLDDQTPEWLAWCAISTADEIVCWDTEEVVTQDVDLSARPVRLSMQVTHACALDELGAIACWGDNSHGQLDVPESLP